VNVHLVNPSSVSFGTAVITPRWQYVIAAATPRSFGDPMLVDETLFQMDPDRIQHGDAIGIGIHTANAFYEIGKMARKRGAYVIFGGIHAMLYPEEALELGGAHAVIKGDGDIVWALALADCVRVLRNRSTWAARLRPATLFRPGGISFHAIATCGRRCRQFEVVPNTAL
jgi:hypothetical protein